MCLFLSSDSQTKIRKKLNEQGGYIYELDISDNQHSALKKGYDRVRKDLDMSALEYRFEEYIDDTINDFCRKIRNPNQHEEDKELVVGILKEHPDWSTRQILEQVKLLEKQMIDEIIKDYEEGRRED